METLRKILLGLAVLVLAGGVALAAIFGPTVVRELRKAAQMPRFDPSARVSGPWLQMKDGRILVVGAQFRGARSAEFCDPDSGAFSDAPGLAHPRAFDPRVALLPDGSVLVAGGRTGDHQEVLAIERFDPVRNAWTTVGRIARDSRISDLVPLKDGTVLLITEDGEAAGIQRFDPGTGALAEVGHPSMVVNGRPLGTLLEDGRVLVTHTDYGLEAAEATNAFIFDPATGRTLPLPPMAQGRGQHQATRLADGRVLVTGGSHEGPPSAELFDPAIGRFSPAAEMVAPRALHVATALPDGRVLILQGVASARTGPLPDVEKLLVMKPEERIRNMPKSIPLAAEAEIFDPRTGRFTPTAEPPSRLGTGFGSTTSPGRADRGGMLFMTVHGLARYEPATGTWSFPAMGARKPAGR